MKFVMLDFTAAAPPDTMLTTALLVTLSAVAVLLFCWLGVECLTKLGSDKKVKRSRSPERYRGTGAIRPRRG